MPNFGRLSLALTYSCEIPWHSMIAEYASHNYSQTQLSGAARLREKSTQFKTETGLAWRFVISFFIDWRANS